MAEEDKREIDGQRVRRRREASQAAYARSKSQSEHVLLRLRKGSLAMLDAARAADGLSRSAYIDSLLEAASPPRHASIDAPTTASDTARSIGDEFEALFGGGA